MISRKSSGNPGRHVISIVPIGYVHNDRKAAIDDAWDDVISTIELAAQIPAEAMNGLGDFSHVEVIYHFHLAHEKYEPSRHPRGNENWPKVGIFAQRGKDRPNRIGVCVAEIISRNDRTLKLRGLDAIDGTPVLDLKPVMTEFLPRGEVRQPHWSRELMRNYWEQSK